MKLALLLFAGLILPALFLIHSLTSTNRLHSAFTSLGVLQGKTYFQILNVAGEPNAVFTDKDPEGESIIIRRWESGRYRISLVFDENNICLGASEHNR